MLSFEPNIVVVDDIIDEVDGIIDLYQKEGIGVKYFNAHLTEGEEKPKVQFSNINIIYLDVHFTKNTDDYDPTHCAAWIDSLIPEFSFYILVLWSKETEKENEILEELDKINKPPFVCFAEQKTDYQTKNGWDFKELYKSVSSSLADIPELDELAIWKKSVLCSSNIIIGHLTGNISPKNLKKKLQKIIKGHGGSSVTTSNDHDFKREILFDALDLVLIANTKEITPFSEISETNINSLYKIPEDIQGNIDTKLNSWFHFKLHKEPLNQEIIKPGLISTFKNKLLKDYYNIQNDENIKEYLKHQLTKSLTASSNTELIDICVLISRPCDVAQNKYGKNLKLISGVLIKNPVRKENAQKDFRKGSSNMVSVKLYDHLQLSETDKDIAIIFDYRYVFSVPEKMFIDKFKNLKIFNKELLSEIQVEYSAYSSRLGITQII